MKVNITIILICSIISGSFGQISVLDNDLIADKSMLRSIGENNNLEEHKFSFNTYSTMNLDEFAETFPFQDTDRYTLFMVFEQSKKGTIANISSNNHSIEIGDSYITTQIRRPLKLVTGKPHILTYKGSNGRALKNKMLKGEFRFSKSDMDPPTESFDRNLLVADVISYDRILSKKEIKIQESSLSIKYGISLPRDSAYFNSAGIEIFNGKNTPYNHRVSAIGVDNGYNLNKSKSKNTSGESILTVHNSSSNSDVNSLVFYADNGAELEFEDEVLLRKWKFTNESHGMIIAHFSFDTNEFDINSTQYDYTIVQQDSSDDVVEYPVVLSENKISCTVEDDLNGKIISIKRSLKQKKDLVSMSFPTPTTHTEAIPIVLTSKKDLAGTLVILDSKGSIVSDFSIEIKSENPLQIKVNVHHPGVYFASFSGDDIFITTKIITF